MNICSDCAYFKRSYYVGSVHVSAKCVRRELCSKPSRVDGRVYAANPNTERKQGGRCGEDGRYFVQRQVPQPRGLLGWLR